MFYDHFHVDSKRPRTGFPAILLCKLINGKQGWLDVLGRLVPRSSTLDVCTSRALAGGGRESSESSSAGPGGAAVMTRTESDPGSPTALNLGTNETQPLLEV